MQIKRRKKTGFLETCATSDLAFLLIIYFLVIAGFNINKGFLINLPVKDSTKLIIREDLLRFEMDSNGQIIYGDQELNIINTRTIIQKAQRENPNIAVIITIDSKTRWQNVVSFVELAQDLKIDSFSFSMKKDNQ
ncbi:MAG: biopolymer transporter ExbD [Treponema sp.]|nr:biopolymer transporter ExbD [Treponema sp.]